MPAISQSFVHLCNHSAFVALANLRYINALNNNNNNNHWFIKQLTNRNGPTPHAT